MVLRGRQPMKPSQRPEQSMRKTRRRSADALAQVPFFASLSKKQLARLAEEADVVSFHAGQAIVEEGMLGETMFVILSGEARVLKGSRRLGTVRPGDAFGEIAVLDGSPRSATVIAETPLTAVRLFRRTLLRLMEAEPRIALKILDGIVRRIRDLTSSIEA
jgi:CRP/FNR family transcriptional regulator, cyclic AMP receptor protein